MEIFLEAQVQPNVKHFHPYDVLFTFYTKTWLPRSRCGIYFGFSPNHSRSVALILNPQTGLVSPQFHVKFDDLFETTDYPRNTQLDPAEWQHKTGFKSKKFGRVVSTNHVKTKPANQPRQSQQPPRPTPPAEPLPMDPDNIWVPEGAPDKIEPDLPTPPTVESEPEPAR